MIYTNYDTMIYIKTFLTTAIKTKR